jgi:hypothetical protein
LLGGAGLERVQKRPGGQFGPRIGAQQRRAALLPGGRVEALEHRLHLLGRGDPVQAGRGGGAADEAAWGSPRPEKYSSRLRAIWSSQ